MEAGEYHSGVRLKYLLCGSNFNVAGNDQLSPT